MRTEEFNKIVDDVCENTKMVLKSKAEDYASDADRLHNFKIAARIDDTTPEKALWGMAKKHLVSIIDIKNMAGMKRYSPEFLREKLGDMRNYLILLEALMLERISIPDSIMRTASRLGSKSTIIKDVKPRKTPRSKK